MYCMFEGQEEHGVIMQMTDRYLNLPCIKQYMFNIKPIIKVTSLLLLRMMMLEYHWWLKSHSL